MTLSCAFDVALVQKLALCTAVSKNTALPVLMGMLGAVVKRIQNLKTVRRSAAIEFVHQILLLIAGIRTAYLLDLFQVSVEKLQEMVELILKGFSEAKCHLLILEFSTGDFLILSIHKFLPLLCHCLENFEVIDISRAPARLLLSEEKSRINEFLETSLQELREFCTSLPPQQIVHNFHFEMEPNTTLGYEFFAGWLLGYPVVYNCPLLPSPEIGVLSMQELRKFSLFVSLQSAKGERAEQVSVQEFTVPQMLLPLLQSHIQEQLHKVMTMNLAESLSGWELEWNLTEDLITSPAVVF
jgi:hypothetical protein